MRLTSRNWLIGFIIVATACRESGIFIEISSMATGSVRMGEVIGSMCSSIVAGLFMWGLVTKPATTDTPPHDPKT